MNKEEKKTRKRKIDNDDKPKRRRAPPKPKQGEINDREITYSLWKYKNEINDNVKIECSALIKNNYWNDRYINI